MSKSPQPGDYREVALYLNTDPQFLEKDFFVCKAIRSLAAIDHDQFYLVFCGGTSLLHGHKIINRFSEDADFRVLRKPGVTSNRKDRRKFREIVRQVLNATPELSTVEGSIRSRDESRFFSLFVSYPMNFEGSRAIKPYIKIECSFEDEAFPGIEVKDIRPIIVNFLELDNGFKMPCLSLHETAADKLSALTWRVLDRQKEKGNEKMKGDPTIVRHLYDLYAIFNKGHVPMSEIVKFVVIIYLNDRNRLGGVEPSSLVEAMKFVLDLFLHSESHYREEYEQYVTQMCFGSEHPPSFDDAAALYAKISELTI